jgi:hypothetical protein
MESHRREPAARFEESLGGGKAAHELAKLVVDRNAQGLEGARRRMGHLAAPRRGDAGDEPGKLERRRKRLRWPVGDDGAGDAARGPLLAEVIEDVGDRRLVLVAEDVGGRAPLALHAHVERRVEPERKPAPRLVELHRRNPDVEHDAIGRLDAETLRRRVELAEARFHQPKPAAGRRLKSRAGPNGRRVAIEGDHPGAAIEKRARIAAGAKGGVDIEAAGPRLERRHRLIEKDGNVAKLGRNGSAHRGVSPDASASRSARNRRTRARASSR